MEYIRVVAIPANKDYIIVRTQNGMQQVFPRAQAKHVRVGDFCTVSNYRGRIKLTPLTDDAEIVSMEFYERKDNGHIPRNRSLVPYIPRG